MLLHGWLDNVGSLAPLLPCLQQQLPGAQLVALDMAGHGRSDHRPDGYLMVDYASDILLAATALGWSTFGIIGHSLGGNAACIAAGTQPERISRLVLLDITGPVSEPGVEAPAALARSVAWAAERSQGKMTGKKVFATVEDAAKARAEKNKTGPLVLKNSMLIASRGTKPVAGEGGQQGVEWSSDQYLLQPTRQYLPHEEVLLFLSKVQCAVLVINARDGIYYELLKRAGRCQGAAGRGIPLTHALARPWRAYLYGMWTILRVVAGIMGLVGMTDRRKSWRKMAAWVLEGARTGARLRHIARLRYEELDFGGHHFHMNRPKDVADIIAKWLESKC